MHARWTCGGTNRAAGWTPGCMTCSLALALACLPGMVAAATVWVGPGDQPGRGTREALYSFAQALASGTQTDVRIEPGTAILLLDGTYRPASPNRHPKDEVRAIFPLVFRIEVSGAPDQPITIAPEPGATAYLDGTLEVDASHIRITGLEIGPADYAPTTSAPPAVALLSSRNVELVNCNLFGSCSTVAAMQPSKDITISGCLIHDSCGLPTGRRQRRRS